MKDHQAKTEATPGPAAQSSAEAADLTGRTLGDFHVLRRLGEGGMGTVYLAEQISLKRRVALKLLRGELANNETSRKRFEAEAKAVAKLNHANIVQVYAVGEENGLRYMALEYVDGRNLREYLHRKGTPELPLALSITRQVAAALQRAGEAGIIHRDIKPENILLTRKGEVKVADFGLSRTHVEGQPPLNLTQSGTTMGTPLYMSPEQVQGKPVDIRTDIYSLGVTCYHMLAGQPPFEGENAFAVAIQHVQNEPLPLEAARPDLPGELVAVVAKMMAKKPEERYQTPREILKDLKSLGEILAGNKKSSALIAEKKPVRAAPTQLMIGPTGRFRRLWWGAAAVLLTAAVGVVAGVYLRPVADDPREEEKTPADHPGAQALLGGTKDRETALFSLVQDTANPGKDQSRILEGVDHRLRLGVHLLNQRELDPAALGRADEFFKEQLQSNVAEYRWVGRLGEAVVVAFQDAPEPSVEAFQEALPERLALRPELFRHPDFLKQVALALEHNERNCDARKIDYPARLRVALVALRRPINLPTRKPALEKK